MEGLHQFAEAMRLIYGIQVFIIFSITITFLVFIYKKYERGKKIKVLLILFLLWMCYVVNFFFHTQIHYVKQNIKAKYYLLIKDYDKAMDAYLDIQVYDAIESKIEDTYIKGVAYYYDNAKYRECIKFIDKTEDKYYDFIRHDEQFKPWKKYDFDYMLNSYKGLYSEAKAKNEKQEIFDIIVEIKDRYKNDFDVIEKEGFDFYYDFNKYEAFDYIKDKGSVYFGKIGMSEMGFSAMKREVGWRLLYREENKIYLVCDMVLISRYLTEKVVDALKYENTDMYSFLNDLLYNEMFDEKEKEAIIKIDNEYISLLSEEIINKMIDDNKGQYLNDLIYRVPISYLVDPKNGGSNQRFWIKSDIINGEAKYIVNTSGNKVNISYVNATRNDINILPVICVNTDIIREYGALERQKQDEEKHEEEIAQEKEVVRKDEQSKAYSIELREKIKAMKSIKEYSDDATIDDFDTLIIGDRKEQLGHREEDMPIAWILLEKDDNKALLLSKYSLFMDLYEQEYVFDINFRDIRKFNFIDEVSRLDIIWERLFNDDEKKYILETELTVSKNDMFPVNNDLRKVKTKLFFLSINEIKKYFTNDKGETLSSKLKTLCEGFESDDYGNELGWWLRDIGKLWWTAACIDSEGNLCEKGVLASKCLGQRVAMWVEYK